MNSWVPSRRAGVHFLRACLPTAMPAAHLSAQTGLCWQPGKAGKSGGCRALLHQAGLRAHRSLLWLLWLARRACLHTQPADSVCHNQGHQAAEPQSLDCCLPLHRGRLSASRGRPCIRLATSTAVVCQLSSAHRCDCSLAVQALTRCLRLRRPRRGTGHRLAVSSLALVGGLALGRGQPRCSYAGRCCLEGGCRDLARTGWRLQVGTRHVHLHLQQSSAEVLLR